MYSTFLVQVQQLLKPFRAAPLEKFPIELILTFPQLFRVEKNFTKFLQFSLPIIIKQCASVIIYLTGMIGCCLLSVQDNSWLTITSRYLTKVVSWRCLEYWSPSSKGLTRVRRGTIFSLKIFNSGISLRDKLWKVV